MTEENCGLMLPSSASIVALILNPTLEGETEQRRKKMSTTTSTAVAHDVDVENTPRPNIPEWNGGSRTERDWSAGLEMSGLEFSDRMSIPSVSTSLPSFASADSCPSYASENPPSYSSATPK